MSETNFSMVWKAISQSQFIQLGNKYIGRELLNMLSYQSQNLGLSITLISGKFWAGFQPNHIDLLEEAALYYRKNITIVAFNSTKSLNEFHNFPKHGFYSDFDRAELVSHFAYVDFVCRFDEKTPVQLCQKLRPSVLIKGEDWKGKDIPEETYCGSVRFVKQDKKYHASDKIRKPWENTK